MEPNVEVIGAQIVNEMVGEEAKRPGFDAQFGINAAAELLSRGVNTYQNQEETKKRDALEKTSIANALQADVAWANAEVMLEQANKSKDEQKIAAASVLASSMASAASGAGAALSPVGAAKRISSANDMAKQAAERSFAAPQNVGLAAAMRAWQKVAAAAASQTASMPGGSTALELARQGSGGLGFLSRRVGPFSVGGWLIAVPAGGVGLWGLVKLFKMMFGRKR